MGGDLNRKLQIRPQPEGQEARLGTDWRMGIGVIKFGLITRNGGKTWEQFSFPEIKSSSSTLSGLSFCGTEMTSGVVSLMSTQSDVMYPNLFFTDNGGKDWTECFFAWDQLPDEISFLQKVDSLTFENGFYTLILSAGNRKVRFQSQSLFDEWVYGTNWQEVDHYNG
jgi:hypothetical protein